ncbi:MAG: hypothetical protein EHM36_14755, partial [Deltaproteobacteria bacterium]
MPGIAGIITKGPVKEKVPGLHQMVQALIHEPSYTSGIYINEELGVGIGWANRYQSFADCMPVWNETSDVGLIYYGENFADKGLTARLHSRGHRFDPSNATYLVHLYEEQGPDFIKQLNGWFSGVLMDLRKGEVSLFNDRYGMQRIYYHETKEAVYFSSEAKSLLRVHPKLRYLDMKSLGEFFSFGCALDNRTLFSDVSLLPPGSVWNFENGSVKRKHRYFDPDTWEHQTPLGNEAFYKNFRETFGRILPKYFDTPNGVALSLTGGLDTRMILSGIDIPRGQLPCYTFGGIYRDCFDVKIARKVAKVCDQTHQVLEVGKEFFPQFPTLAEKTVYITDGNLNVSGAPDLYVNRLAREIAPVRLTGNYGSEIMRGARHL